MQILWSLELAVNLAFQSLGSWLTGPMTALSFLGQEEFFLVVMPILFWCLDPALGLRVGMILLLSDSLNGCLKIIFHGPRPYWVSQEVRALSSETSFGMPSGHGQNAAAVWGILAASLKKNWLWAVVLVFILGIGLSRIYLGMHFTSDVLAGWAVGAGLVWGFVRCEKPLVRWLRNRSTSQLALLGLLTSLALLGLNQLARLSVASVSIPYSWVRYANGAHPTRPIDPLSITGTITTAGIWLGVTWGAAWLWSRGGYDGKGSAWQQCARLLIGMLGLGIFYILLGKVFPRTDDLPGYFFRYFRYMLVGLWVSGGAPLLFIRLGIARRRESVQPAVERALEPEPTA